MYPVIRLKSFVLWAIASATVFIVMYSGQKAAVESSASFLPREIPSVPTSDIVNLEGRYILQEIVGIGGFGKTFRGKRVSDSKEVIVKKLMKPKLLLVNSDLSLPTEVKALDLASHIPGVVKMIEYFETNDFFFIIFEFLSKSFDLNSLLGNSSSLPEFTAKHLLSQLLHTTILLARKNVFHNDIKASNILIHIPTVETKLIDFGSAMVVEKGAPISLPSTITKEYAPPEYIDDIYEPEKWAVWSIGLLLYDMLSGKRLQSQATTGLIADVLFLANVTSEAQDLISQCLKPNYTERPGLLEIAQHPWFSQDEALLEKRPTEL